MATQHHEEPIVGGWYDSKDFPECFRVVDYDKHNSVEIQYFDGEIEEIDYETWVALHPLEIPEPEDAMAPYEMEREDILELLNGIENDEHLDDHLRYLEEDESDWN